MTKEEALIRKLEYASGIITGVSATCDDDQSGALLKAIDSIVEVIDAYDEIEKKKGSIAF